MLFSFSHLSSLLIGYTYVLLFPLVLVEGPIVTIIAGFLVSTGYMNFAIVYGVVVLADLTGDCIYYLIGRWGREGFINHWGRYLGLTTARVQRIEKRFEKDGWKILLLGKVSHGIGSVFLVSAGLVKMRFSTFIGYNTVATLLKSMIFMLVGFYFGFALTKVQSVLHSAALVTFGLAIIFGGLYLLKKKEDQL